MILALFLAVCLTAPASAEETGEAEDLFQELFGEEDTGEDQLLLRVSTERNIALSEALQAWSKDDRLYVDLLSAASAFGFALSREGPVISGWFGKEENRFHLLAEEPELRLRGEDAAILEEEILLRDGTVFVDLDSMGLWFDLDYSLERDTQVLVLTGAPVPAEGSILRKRARESLQISDGFEDPDEWITADHGLFSWPILRSVTSSDWNRATGRIRINNQVVAEADFMHTRTRVTGNLTSDDGLTDLRIESKRAELDADLPYTSLALGDVSGFRVVNAAASAQGLGFAVTNKPLTAPRILGEENFEGDAPPGWEAELYRNDSLIDFQVIGEDGRFSFQRVALANGVNEIKIVLYGPQGQTRIIEERVLANAGNPAKGQIHYSVSALAEDRTLLGLREDFLQESDPEFAKDPIRFRFVGEAAYGLTSEWSVFMAYSQAPDEERELQFASLGLRGSHEGMPMTLDVTKGFDDAEGHALRAFTRVPFFGGSLSLTHSEFVDFTGEENRKGDNFLTRASQALLSLPVKFVAAEKDVSLLNSVTLTREQQTDGRQSWAVQPTTTVSSDIGSLTNRLSFDLDRVKGRGTDTRASGSLTGTHTIGDFRFRTRADYGVQPVREYRRTTFDMNMRLDDSYAMQAKLSKEHLNNRATSGTLGMRAQYAFGELGFSLSADSSGGRRANMTFSTGLQRATDDSGFDLRRTRDLNGGAVLIRVFVDHNGNSLFDAGDEALENVMVKARSSRKHTDANGLAGISGLPIYRPLELSLDGRSLKVPFLSGVNRKRTVALKEGSVLPVDFPLRPSGEIEGLVEVSIVTAEGEVFHRAVPNVTVEALDQAGQVVASTQSSFDGSYVLTNVPLGSYRIRVSPESLNHIGAAQVPTVADQQNLTQQGDWITGATLSLAYINPAMNVGPAPDRRSAPEDALFDTPLQPSDEPLDPMQGIPEELQHWFD